MNNTILQLQRLVALNKLPHSFILTGIELDLVQESVAFAKWALCGNLTNINACDNCRVCQLLKANTSPDFMLLEPIISGNSKAIKIEQIRELIQFVQTRPQLSAIKIVLLSGAEYLNVQAANALLKILEEPPVAVHIILATTNPKLLLETIISRCPIFNIRSGAKDIFPNKLLLQDILLDLYKTIILQDVNLVITIEKWMHNEAKELLTYFWLIIVELIQYNFTQSCNYTDLDQEKIAKISKVQRLQQLWSILDKILETRKNLLLGRQVNIQLFLEGMMIYWIQGINNARN